jgi:carbamoyltransferase
MLIIAIHPGHNATVGLINDGRVVGLLSQEKVDNIKNSANFPIQAAQALLEECGFSWNDIAEVAIAGRDVFPSYCYDYLFDRKNVIQSRLSPIGKSFRSLERGALGRMLPGVFRIARGRRKAELINSGRAELKKRLANTPLSGRPVTYVDHHQCHAYSSYYGLRRDDAPAIIFTADGSGDDACATVSVVRNGRVDRIAQTDPSASLGGIYSNTTYFLGMRILEHEYKVMGLAPYCKGYEKDVYERIFAPAIWLDPDNPLLFKSKVDTSKFYDYLVERAVGERFDNIAGAVQMLLEERFIEWIRAGIARTGIRNVYTGGGVFMNVKLNKRIQEIDEVDRVHFLPSSGDESNPIGAGYALALARGDTPKPLDDLYLGISYGRDALAEFIDRIGLRNEHEVVEHGDIETRIATLLAEREIVARFSGRCEWGARSLGNRAILAHPSHMESFYVLNDLVKARDFWMPFAPSILDTDANRYLENYRPDKNHAPYMITAYKASPRGQIDLRAAMHQADHSIRPQVLTSHGNPEFYRLIAAFKALTGVGAVLNTSLNLHGYSLVATPAQAIQTLEQSGLRYLALGPFLIKKC